MKLNPASEKYISLATFRRDGREVRTPVWVVGDDGGDGGGDGANSQELYVFSESKAGKVKRIRNNGRISIAPCDLRGKLTHDLWQQGSAEIVTDASKIENIYQIFDKKYGWQMRLLNFIAKLNGRYHKRAVLALKLNQIPGD